MKTLLLLLLPLASFSQSGYYFGGSLGIAYGEKQHSKRIEPKSFLFSVVGAYRYHNLVAEIEPTYAGIIAVPVSTGYVLDIGRKADIALQGGIAYAGGIYPLAKARFQFGNGYIQASYYGQAYFFSIGVRPGNYKKE